MKQALLSGVALLALAGAASAANLSVTYAGLPAGGSYFAPTATSSTQPYEQGVTGSVTDVRRSPFANNTTAYNAVEANGSATFGFSDELAFRVLDTSFQAPFGTGNNNFTFVWGSPDTYNLLSFYNNGSFLGSVNGGGSPTTGSGGYLATVTGMGAFNQVVFQSQGLNAFEFAGISTVPLPASAPLFGAALVALGAAGYGLKRKKAVAAV